MKNLVVVTLPDVELFGECICGQDALDDFDMFDLDDMPASQLRVMDNITTPAATPDPIESDATRVNSTLPPSSPPREESPEIQAISEWEWEAALSSQQRAGVFHHTNVFLEDIPL